MRGSRDRIITSHVGSLPRPENLIEANRLREQNPAADENKFQDLLQQSVSDIVRKQKDLGIDVPNDGEFGKSMGYRVNYRAWLSYSFYRLAGLVFDQTVSAPPRPAHPGDLVIARFDQRRDRTKFAAPMPTRNSAFPWGRLMRVRSVSGRCRIAAMTRSKPILRASKWRSPPAVWTKAS